ncbi:MAG: hypothetical protein HY062_18695, partial [Bacteroidetes bacterium]|nr:hypothetical protein [Bacteroidota bacterium]
GNSHRTSNPGATGTTDSYYQKYVSSVAAQQSHAVKFTEIPTTRGGNTPTLDEPIRVNSNGTPIGTGGVKQPHTYGGDVPTRSNTPIRTIDEPVRNTPIRDYNPNTTPVRQQDVPLQSPDLNTPVRQNPVRNQEPVKQQPIDNTPRFETPVRQNSFPTPSFPSNNGGGGNSPGGGGGGGHRPR